MKRRYAGSGLAVLSVCVVSGWMLFSQSPAQTVPLHASPALAPLPVSKLSFLPFEPLNVQGLKTVAPSAKTLPKLPYRVYQNGTFVRDFDGFSQALAYAKTLAQAAIYFHGADEELWTNQNDLPAAAEIQGVPMLYQMPDLERGCEVTSLAMILNYLGNGVDKMTLADQIKKDPTPFEEADDGIHYGNPNDGFVGDMVTFENSGYGVYHGPVAELAERYMPGKTVDLTGSDFDTVLSMTAKGYPVWVITNEMYTELPPEQFETWHTPDGDISITYLEHSLVVTGYDESQVYLNDPLLGEVKVHRADFAKAWEQLGSQAITIVNEKI